MDNTVETPEVVDTQEEPVQETPVQDESKGEIVTLWAQYGILRARKDSVEADMARVMQLIADKQKKED